MSYHVTHWSGAMESDFPVERFSELLDELSLADPEHPDVSVAHESEWSLSIYTSGFLVLENLEEGEPMHLEPGDVTRTLALMRAVAEGRIREVLSEPWRPGYPP